MFNFVHGNRRFIQVVMVIIVLPFAFFGIESYFSQSGTSTYVASVGEHKISQQEYARALDSQQQRLREALGGRVDPALLDSPDMRAAVLNTLIRERLLASEAAENGMTVTDAELQAAIAAIPAFQDNGKFSLGLYENFLRNQNLAAKTFEQSIEQGLLQERLMGAYADTALVPDRVAERITRLNEQQREVSQVLVSQDQFLTEIKLEADAAKNYYDSHEAEFQIPEQVRVEYLVLSLDKLTGQVEVSDEELQTYYREHAAEYEKPEEREASHILISAAADADEKTRAAAKAKTQQLAEQAKKDPAKFAELAKKNSQDPGSAEKSGDLGAFRRGAMVKPFEDAVFGMKVGEIAGPVESPFGYHIIKLNAIKPGGKSSFDQVRKQIEAELKKQKAGARFAEAAENFSNMVYEQSDSLKPASEAAKLEIQTSPLISRKGAELPLLNNDKLLEALFSEDALANKRNTEAIEVAPNTLVSARVMEHKPASLRPFEDVKAEISKRLLFEEAGRRARQDAEARLAQLQKGEDAKLTWSPAQTISRAKHEGFDEAALRQIFRADSTALPAYTVITNPEGAPVVVKISRVNDAEIGDDKRKAVVQQLRQASGQETLLAYLASIREEADIKIMQENLERRER
ncbi:MAG: SurA N-terminal domain-containing protein [Burkholderiales bacterium]|nr:SurA N-terminal domain-containing protein [Burkholderiales bacterium]